MGIGRRGGNGGSYALVVAGFVVAYAVATVALGATKDFTDQGPLSLHQPALTVPLTGGVPLSTAVDRCFPDPSGSGYDHRVVGGVVRGHSYYACFGISQDTGDLMDAAVLDAVTGLRVTDVDLIQAGGAWPFVGLVKSTGDLIFGGLALVCLLGTPFLYYRRRRPGAPAVVGLRFWQSGAGMVTMVVVVPFLGWIALAVLPRVSPARKIRAAFQAFFVTAGLVLAVLWMIYAEYPEPWGATVLGLVTGGFAIGMVTAHRLLRPEGFGWPEEPLAPGPAGYPAQPSPYAAPGPYPQPYPAPPSAPPPAPPQAPAPSTSGVRRVTEARAASRRREDPDPNLFRVQRPDELPSFRDIGGMAHLKQELKDTLGLLLAFSGEADRYRITWNGLLLHGPPGVGKTFLARAAAGEFGLNVVVVSTSDLVSAYRGDSARNLRTAFRTASAHRPCLLFFDEFDSLAQRRDDFPDQESRRTVNQLLQSLEEWRSVRELIVVAATNSITNLDEAVTRPGRFDRHIRIDLPDASARRAIFLTQLRGRPTSPDLDLDELVGGSEGLTPAAIARTVEVAALAALREAAVSGTIVHITTAGLARALKERGGQDRPTVEHWTWEQLVVPETVKRELKQLQVIVRDPDRAQAFGVDAPSGILLSGPPGTGKTTIAKIFAAQSGCSFYPITPADITSMWVGEAEENIRRLFTRARENAPSIIFIDEIDALASRREGWASGDRLVNQLLAEMDGLSTRRGVLVVGATNRPDQLDPALLRGGRLSKTIDIALPDVGGRLRLLQLHSRTMPLVDVDLRGLAERTEGMSGADIKALCQQAALHAVIRIGEDDVAAQVTLADFTAALPGSAAGSSPEVPGTGGYI